MAKWNNCANWCSVLTASLVSVSVNGHLRRCKKLLVPLVWRKATSFSTFCICSLQPYKAQNITDVVLNVAPVSDSNDVSRVAIKLLMTVTSSRSVFASEGASRYELIYFRTEFALLRTEPTSAMMEKGSAIWQTRLDRWGIRAALLISAPVGQRSRGRVWVLRLWRRRKAW